MIVHDRNPSAAPPSPPGSIPEHLLAEVRAGNCVAFVGAGFSAAAVPSWGELLIGIADHATPITRDRVHDLLTQSGRSALDYEAAAQLLRDDLSSEAFTAHVAKQVQSGRGAETMTERVRLLRGIPFRAVLTTNFDPHLSGDVPGRDAYLSVLRSKTRRWWNPRFWDPENPGPAVVKLHGDAGVDPPARVVLTREDYRERLYRDPAYMTFLRSIFATTTVLYLGFSFTDAYLNELRSEILALLEHRGGDRAIAYAVVNDVPEVQRRYFREHEGIEILSYDSDGGTDFAGFDTYLRAIHDESNPRYVLGRLIEGRRILWSDPTSDPGFGMELLEQAALDRGAFVESVRTPDEALGRLRSATYDLVITRWGHQLANTADGETISQAEYLLTSMRTEDLRAPVVVFASPEFAEENKRAATALGALNYTYSWEGLFRTIAGLFEHGRATG